MSDRYFTVEEAQGLVGWLADAFRNIAPLREQAGRQNAEIAKLEEHIRSNGGSHAPGQLAGKRRELRETSDQIDRQVALVEERGCVVKSVQQGLVDFPSIREGREVYLCWLEGEPEIGYGTM